MLIIIIKKNARNTKAPQKKGPINNVSRWCQEM